MKSNSTPRSAIDAVRHNLRHASGLFEKLLYVSAGRDTQSGRYRDPVLALDFAETEIDAAFRQQHSKAFAVWLALGLRQQHAELLEYLEYQPNRLLLLQQWTRTGWYDRLVPSDAIAPTRDLFVSDFEIVAALVEADLKTQPTSEQCGASDLVNQMSAAPPRASHVPDLHLTGEAGLKRLVYQVLAKEHFGWLYDKGKVKVERYLEQVNELRKAEALPPISSVAGR